MKKPVYKTVCMVSAFCLTLAAFALNFPRTCLGQDCTMTVEVSPNIINIDANRLGDIRIFTNLRYSEFYNSEYKAPVFIYINPQYNPNSESVDNITPTRDSLGNLILKFNLEDLKPFFGVLDKNGPNTFQVVIVKSSDVTCIGEDETVVIEKKGR